MTLWVGRSVWTVTGSVVTLLLLSGLILVFDGPCQYETTYHCAEVVADTERPSGRLPDPRSWPQQLCRPGRPNPSRVSLHQGDGRLDRCRDAARPARCRFHRRWGVHPPGFLAATGQGTEHRVLEIDASLVDIGRRHLGFEDQAEVIVDDARRSITEVAPGSIDVVVGDAFTGLTVPWHLTTVEFVEMIRDTLAPGGFYTVNVIDRPEARFARAEAATLSEVFGHVAVFAPESYFTGARGGNYVIVGSDDPIDMHEVRAALSSRGGIEVGSTGEELARFHR